MTSPIVAVIPAYNEASRIGPVVDAACVYLPVIVVDDGSTDGTAARARTAGARVIEQRPNRGKGAALRVGFREALGGGAVAVLTLDADGQHDPADIAAFLRAFDHQPVDLIVGRRNFRRMPPVRRLANGLGRLVFSYAVGRPIPDNQSGYRLLSRRLVEAVLDSRESGFEFELEMIAVCVTRGWPISWIPIRTIYAGEPSHIRPLHHLRSFIRTSLAARRRVRQGHSGH
jgi:glycosyltransferase involved in cell wall biosynthesis